MKTTHIVLFDGYCHLCNGAVDFLLRYERNHTLQFAPLNGQAHKNIETQVNHPVGLDSLGFYRNEKVYVESTAALLLVDYLKWPFHVLKLFWILPPSVRDAMYRYIARNRYKWWGKRNDCRLLNPAYAHRFLR